MCVKAGLCFAWNNQPQSFSKAVNIKQEIIWPRVKYSTGLSPQRARCLAQDMIWQRFWLKPTKNIFQICIIPTL